MRQELRNRHRAGTPVHGDTTPIDLPDASRQFALFETGRGWQHRVIEVLVALLAASMLVPLPVSLRSGSTDRR